MSVKAKEKENRGKNKRTPLFLQRLFSRRNSSSSDADLKTSSVQADGLKTPSSPSENKNIFDHVNRIRQSSGPSDLSQGSTDQRQGSTDLRPAQGQHEHTARSNGAPINLVRTSSTPGRISTPGRVESRPPSTGNRPATPSKEAASHFYYNINSPAKPPSTPPRSSTTPTRSSSTPNGSSVTPSKPPLTPNRGKSPRQRGRGEGRSARGSLVRNESLSIHFNNNNNSNNDNIDLNDNSYTNPESSNPFPPLGGVPGMDPPRPILHKVCSGYNPADIPEAVVVYSKNCRVSSDWAEYCCKLLAVNSAGGSSKVRQQPVEELSESLGQRVGTRHCEEVIYHADLQVVIISPRFLDWVERLNLNVGRLLHPPRLLGLMLGVLDTDLRPVHLNQLRQFVNWTVVDLKNEAEHEEVTRQISRLSAGLLKDGEKETSSVETKFKLFPRKINPGQNKLLVILDNPHHQVVEEVEVLFCFGDKHLLVDEFKLVKDDIFQIEAPESLLATSSMADVRLYVNRQCFGSMKLKLESSLSLLESAWKHQTNPVNIFSEAFGENFQNLNELGKQL